MKKILCAGNGDSFLETFFHPSSGVLFLAQLLVRKPSAPITKQRNEDRMFGYTLFSGPVWPSSCVRCVTFLLCGMCLMVDSSHRSATLKFLHLVVIGWVPLGFPSSFFFSLITHLFSLHLEKRGQLRMDVDCIVTDSDNALLG